MHTNRGNPERMRADRSQWQAGHTKDDVQIFPHDFWQSTCLGTSHEEPKNHNGMGIPRRPRIVGIVTHPQPSPGRCHDATLQDRNHGHLSVLHDRRCRPYQRSRDHLYRKHSHRPRSSQTDGHFPNERRRHLDPAGQRSQPAEQGPGRQGRSSQYRNRPER